LYAVIESLKQKEEENVLLFGGEPTLRGDLPEIIQTARKLGYKRIKLATNGRTFADSHFLNQIMNEGCYLYEIKLWGSHASLHDKITKSVGSFWETTRGLESLASIPQDRFISIRIPLCQENCTDLENMVAISLSLGVNRIIISYQDYTLSFQDSLHHILNAIRISIFNRTWILTEGIPFCMMKGYEQHLSEIYSNCGAQYMREFQHHRYCRECVYQEVCPGAETRYLSAFGEAGFSPVLTKNHVDDIKALYE
jgi:MoaA/NifB/PqqE/SkfB family radical SAM enzyme